MASETAVVWIQSEEDEKSRVGLSFVASTEAYVAELRVRLEVDGFECDRRVTISDDADGLAAFFADLVENWRGWEGTKQWEALGGHEMAIEARHAARVIEFLVMLRRDYRRDAWEVRVPILIAPGEELTQIAHAIGRWPTYQET